MVYQPHFSHILMLHDICQENPKVYGPFLFMDYNPLSERYSATMRREFAF